MPSSNKISVSISVPSTYIYLTVHGSHKFAWSRGQIGILFTFRQIFAAVLYERNIPVRGIIRRTPSWLSRARHQTKTFGAPSRRREGPGSLTSFTKHPSRMFVTRLLPDFCPVYAVIRPTTTDLNSHGKSCELDTPPEAVSFFTRNETLLIPAVSLDIANLPKLIRSPTKPIEFRFTRNPCQLRTIRYNSNWPLRVWPRVRLYSIDRSRREDI